MPPGRQLFTSAVPPGYPAGLPVNPTANTSANGSQVQPGSARVGQQQGKNAPSVRAGVHHHSASLPSVNQQLYYPNLTTQQGLQPQHAPLHHATYPFTASAGNPTIASQLPSLHAQQLTSHHGSLHHSSSLSMSGQAPSPQSMQLLGRLQGSATLPSQPGSPGAPGLNYQAANLAQALNAYPSFNPAQMYAQSVQGQGQVLGGPQVTSPVSSPPAPVVAPPQHPTRPPSGVMPAKPSPPAKPNRFSFFGKPRPQVPSLSSYSFSRPPTQSPSATNQSFHQSGPGGQAPPLPLRPQGTGSSNSSSQHQSPSPPAQFLNPTPLLPLRPQGTGASTSSGVSHHSPQGSVHSPSPGPSLPGRLSSHGHTASGYGHGAFANVQSQVVHDQVQGMNVSHPSYAQVAHSHDGSSQYNGPLLSLGHSPTSAGMPHVNGAGHPAQVSHSHIAQHQSPMLSSGTSQPLGTNLMSSHTAQSPTLVPQHYHVLGGSPGSPNHAGASQTQPSPPIQPVTLAQVAQAQSHIANDPSPAAAIQAHAPGHRPSLPSYGSMSSESSVSESPVPNASSPPALADIIEHQSSTEEELLPAYHEVNSDEIRLEYHPPVADAGMQELPTPGIDMPAAQSDVEVQALPTPHIDMPAAEAATPAEPVAQPAVLLPSPETSGPGKPHPTTTPGANPATSSSTHISGQEQVGTTANPTLSSSLHLPSVPSALSNALGSVHPMEMVQSLIHDASTSVLASLQAQAVALGSSSPQEAGSTNTQSHPQASALNHSACGTHPEQNHHSYAEAAAAPPGHHNAIHHTTDEHGLPLPTSHSATQASSHAHHHSIPSGHQHGSHPTSAQAVPHTSAHAAQPSHQGHPGSAPTAAAHQSQPISSTAQPSHDLWNAPQHQHGNQNAVHPTPVANPSTPSYTQSSSSPSPSVQGHQGVHPGGSMWSPADGMATSGAPSHPTSSPNAGVPHHGGYPSAETAPIFAPASPNAPWASSNPQVHQHAAQSSHSSNPLTTLQSAEEGWVSGSHTQSQGNNHSSGIQGWNASPNGTGTPSNAEYYTHSSPSPAPTYTPFAPPQQPTSSSPVLPQMTGPVFERPPLSMNDGPSPATGSFSPVQPGNNVGVSPPPTGSPGLPQMTGPVFERPPLNANAFQSSTAGTFPMVQPTNNVSASPPPASHPAQAYHAANPNAPQAWNVASGAAPLSTPQGYGASPTYTNPGYPTSVPASQTQPSSNLTPTPSATYSPGPGQQANHSAQGFSQASNPPTSPSPAFASSYPSQAFTHPPNQASSPLGSAPSPAFSPNAQAPSSAGYQPVDFDSSPGVDPEAFYGSLLDRMGKPTPVLARFADSVFFFMDQHCPILSLRGTGFIDPVKYAWFLLLTGASEDDANAMKEYGLKMFLDMAGIPYKMIVLNGVLTPMLDRRGYLHLVTFECRAIPDDSHKDANKYLAQFQLCDPATNTPFPSPVPRSAFPAVPNIQAQTIVIQWQAQVAAEFGKRKTNAMIAAALGGSGGTAAFGGAAPGSAYTYAQQGAGAPAQAAQEPNEGGGSSVMSAAQKLYQMYQDQQQNQAQQDQQNQLQQQIQQLQQIQAQQAQETQQMYQQMLAQQNQQEQGAVDMMNQQMQANQDLLNQILAGNNPYLDTSGSGGATFDANGMQVPDFLNQLQSSSLPTFDPSQLQSSDLMNQLQAAGMQNFDMSQLAGALPSMDAGDALTSAVGSGLQALTATTDLGSVAGAIVPGLQALAGGVNLVNGMSTLFGAFNNNNDS